MAHELKVIKTEDVSVSSKTYNLKLKLDTETTSESVFDLKILKTADVPEATMEIHELEMIKIADSLVSLDNVSDGLTYARVLLASIEDGKILLAQAAGDLDDIANGVYGKMLTSSLSDGVALLSAASGTLDDITDGDSYGKVLFSDITGGHVLLASCEGNLDDVDEGLTYGKVLITDISAGHILLAECEGDLDDIANGLYSKVLSTDISAGHIKLTECEGTIDSIDNGATYGRVALTDISAGHIKLSECIGSIDSIGDGTSYGRVLATDLSAGHILIAETVGDLDDIADGTTYGKVVGTDISSGHIVLSTAIGDLDDIDDGTSYGKVLGTIIDSGYLYLMRKSADANEKLEITASGVVGYANNVKNFELASGIAYLGDQSNEHIKLSSSGLQVYDGAVLYATYGATTTLGLVASEHISISSTAIQLKDGSTVLTELSGGNILVGQTGANQSNVLISAGQLEIRNNTTAVITLAANGDVTLTGAIIGATNLIDQAITGGKLENFAVGDVTEKSSDSVVELLDRSYAKAKEFYLPRAGALRIKFDLAKSGSAGGGAAYGRIYRNGVAVGTERNTAGTYVTYSEDISGWARGDLCQLYAYASTDAVDVRNFRLYSSGSFTTQETIL